MEDKMRPEEVQKESAKIRADAKKYMADKMLELEKLRHTHIMEELELMGKHKIKTLTRDRVYGQKKAKEKK